AVLCISSSSLEGKAIMVKSNVKIIAVFAAEVYNLGMKILKRLFVFCVSLICAFPLYACSADGGGQSYTESTRKIANPDQGFYTPLYVEVRDGGVYYGNIDPSVQLFHLRIDISAFSSKAGGTDKPFTADALDGLDGLLDYLCKNEKSAIVRLAYDPKFAGSKDMEPSLETMLGHISQFCGVLNKYEITVTAIEAGLIGPWGEMHSSAVAKPEVISRLTAEYIANTANIPVLVRTPKMIYDYIGITAEDAENYTADRESPAYRLGIFNDGYLGSDSDLGTYTNRARDVAFVGRQSDRLPFGGEAVAAGSALNDIENCVPEMFEVHLSYLNSLWDSGVIAKWKNSVYSSSCGSEDAYYGKTAYEYIENRMGYRIVVSGSKTAYGGGKASVKLNFKNLGFGNFNRVYSADLIITDGAGKVVCRGTAGRFDGSASAEYEIPAELAAGEYKVYICVYGMERDGNPAYTVQFANEGIYSETLRANLVGELKI
ncbi:MAG: DUF4832 domain-containing protein, partial [Clostridia bacterium]|nr:DUF4832 domain-containing protein [Clostridia bacterium]